MFSVLSVLILLFCGGVASEHMCSGDGCMLPNDPYVFLGNNVTLNCILTSGNGSENLYFQWRNDLDISEEYQRVISPSVLQLNMPVTTVNFPYVPIYCYDSSKPFESQHVGDQEVQFEYPPRNMTDIKVLVDDWESLALTWIVPKYFNTDDVNFKVVWTAAGANYWYYCTQETDNSCTISGSDYKDSSKYIFNINIKNIIANRSHIQRLEFVPNHYVKTTPVQFGGFNSTMHNVYLWWNHSKNYRKLQFRIVVNRTNTNTSYELFTDEFSITVNGLRPYVTYTFSIYTKINESIYWSGATDVSITTEEDKPDAGMLVTPGSFYVKSPCNDNKRKILVFLRPPDEAHRNGKLIYYNLTYVSSDGSWNLTTNPSIYSFFDTVSLSCDLDYDVYMSVYTEIGGSPPSHLHIPRQDTVTEPSSVRVVNGRNQWHLEWESSGTADNWTIFWCPGKEGFQDCGGEIRWQYSNSSSTVIDYHHGYIYGVSMTTEGGSSGIKWADCIYKNDSVPSSTPTLRSVDADIHLGLTVRWYLDTCKDEVLVTKYIIQYCIVGSDTCESNIVPSDRSEFRIHHLKEGAHYSVRLKQITAAGLEGSFSDGLAGIPRFIGLRTSTIAAIVFVAVIAFVIFTATIIASFRYCFRKCTEKEQIYDLFKIQAVVHHPPSINPPILPGQKENSNSESQKVIKYDFLRGESIDSGRGSLSSPSDNPEDCPLPLSPSNHLEPVFESKEEESSSGNIKVISKQTCHLPQGYAMYARGDSSGHNSTSVDIPNDFIEEDDDVECDPYITASKGRDDLPGNSSDGESSSEEQAKSCSEEEEEEEEE